MKEFFKKIKAWSLISSLANIVIGILFVACPNFTKSTIVYIFAGLLVLGGIIKCINYFRYGIEPFGFMIGSIGIVVGLVLMGSANSLAYSGIFGLIYGLIFMAKGLFAVQTSFDSKRLGAKYWWADTILASMLFAFGITLVSIPATENVLFIILGIAIIIDGLCDLIDTILVTVKVKKTKKSIKDMFTKIPPEKDQIIIDVDENGNQTRVDDNK